MPQITAQIPDTYSGITRPVAVDIIRNLIAFMSLPEDTGLQYLGTAEKAAQIGSTLVHEPYPNKFPYSGKITVDVSEQYIEDRILTAAVKQVENVKFFWDAPLGVSLRPVYQGTEVSISFRYRAASKVEAERWRDEFRQRTGQGRKELLHEASYHYGIPDAMLVILNEIHSMRERVAGYGEDLTEWFSNHASSKITKLTTLAGTQPELVVGETQVGIVGWFEFISQPEIGSKGQDLAQWEAGFDYKFNYDKVTTIVMQYPLMIHNQLMDQKFRPSEPHYQLAHRARYPSHSRFLLDQYTPLYPAQGVGLTGLRVPLFDDWLPDYVAPHTSSVVTLLTSVDLNDPQDLLNLNEIGDYDFDPDVLAFLKIEAPFMTKLYNSIFHLSLFRWAKPTEDGTISADPVTLAVRSRSDLNPRDHHHVRLALVNDLSYLTPEALERLRQNGKAAIKLLIALYPKLYDPNSPYGADPKVITKLLGGRVIIKKDMDHLRDLISSNGLAGIGLERHMYTVATILIIAHKGAPDARH